MSFDGGFLCDSNTTLLQI